MSLEVRFGCADIFYANDSFQPLDFQNPIHHQKGIAMGQVFLDFHHVHNHPKLSVAAPKTAASPPLRQNYHYKRSWRTPRAKNVLSPGLQARACLLSQSLDLPRFCALVSIGGT